MHDETEAYQAPDFDRPVLPTPDIIGRHQVQRLLGECGFGTHDLFHLFVKAGSLAHHWFILSVVVPFGRGLGEDFREPCTRSGDSTSAASFTSSRIKN